MPLKPRNVIDASDPRVSQIGHPSPPWMVNYADLMTELVCFFVIMYALSAALSKPMQAAKIDIEATLTREEVAGKVEITKDGLVISLQEQGYYVFFKSGSADLSDQMVSVLKNLGPTFITLADKNHEIIVEGYTDDVPIRSALYASNWELSTARATNVVKYLVTSVHYPARYIGAIGYGDNRLLPRTPDEDLTAWRSKNRRVVFVVKNPRTDLSKETE